MFKINNKDNRTRSYFTPCSSVSIVNFEHVNADWVNYTKATGTESIFLQIVKLVTNVLGSQLCNINHDFKTLHIYD